MTKAALDAQSKKIKAYSESRIDLLYFVVVILVMDFMKME